jgi:glycosyltransferase involved in cell wall biosynthesis
MGSIPVIIADNYSAPLENFIDWSQFSIRVKESSIDKIPEILSEISKDTERLETMRTSAIEVYEAYFSNQNLAKTVEISLSQHV